MTTFTSWPIPCHGRAGFGEGNLTQKSPSELVTKRSESCLQGRISAYGENAGLEEPDETGELFQLINAELVDLPGRDGALRVLRQDSGPPF